VSGVLFVLGLRVQTDLLAWRRKAEPARSERAPPFTD